MLPSDREWAQLGGLFLLGPLQLLACFICIAIAWWRGARWSMPARVALLAVNVLMALGPIVLGVTSPKENEAIHSFGIALATGEVVAVIGLALVLLRRRTG